MAAEFDELEEAVRRYGDTLGEYVQVEQRLVGELAPSMVPHRGRFLPLILVAVLVMTLPLMIFGRAKFVSTCVGVQVNPGDDLSALITANGTGTTFCLRPGTHRITASGGLSPKTGDVFIGVGSSTILSGSKLVTSWTVSGSDWFATGFLPGSAPSASGTCAAATPLCYVPYDVFYNGTWLTPVASQGALGAGKVFLDYAANRIYVRDNPTSATVEQSWASHLFTGSGDDVQIKNLILQHSASFTNTGAVDPGSGATGWIVDRNEIRWNHAYGTGPGSVGFGETLDLTITANNVHHNGQDGTGADGEGNLVQYNEVHHNSYAGYDLLWDSGNKFGHARNLIVDGNYYHDEIGPGIWCDINCEDIVVSNNYVADTQRGIMFEISCGALIYGNTVVRASDPAGGSWGGIGILISTSEGAEVYNNQVYDSPHSIWAISQERLIEARDCTGGAEHVVKDLYVHNNQENLNFADPPFGAKTGLWTDTGRTDLYSSKNNRFQANTYYDTTPSSEWDWGMTSPPYSNILNFANWQATGNDTTGTVVSSNPTAPGPPALVVGPR